MTDASAFLDSVSQQLDRIGQEGLTKRERLITGLIEVLYEVGYQNTTVSLIGQRAAV